MINKWTRRTVFLPNHNHYVDSIMEGDKFIIECGCLGELFTSHLIASHNESIEQTYKKGLNEGVEIAKEVYKSE